MLAQILRLATILAQLSPAVLAGLGYPILAALSACAVTVVIFSSRAAASRPPRPSA